MIFHLLLMHLSQGVEFSETLTRIPFLYPYETIGHRSIYLNNTSEYVVGTCMHKSDRHEFQLMFVQANSTFDTLEAKYSKSYVSPVCRGLYGMFSDSNFIYIYGGKDQFEVFKDFWKYDLKHSTWTNISDILLPFNIPALYDFGFISYYAKFFDHKKRTWYNHLIIAGGITAEDTYNNIVWVLIYNSEIESSLNRIDAMNSIKKIFDKGLAGLKMIRYKNSLFFISGFNLQNKNSSVLIENVFKVKDSEEFSDTHYNLDYVSFNLTNHKTLLKGEAFLDGSKLYQLFGVDFRDNKFEYNENLYSLDMENINDGWGLVKTFKPDNVSIENFSVVKQNNYVYLIGGLNKYGIKYTYYQLSLTDLDISKFNDVLHYNPGSVLVRMNRNIYLFGGREKNELSHSSYNLNFEKYVSDLNKKIVPFLPSERKGLTYATEGSNLVFVGGINEELEYLSDFWLFNLYSNTLTELTPKNNNLKGFAYACAVISSPYIIVIGGYNQNGVPSKNVRILDSKSSSIKIIEVNNMPRLANFSCEIIEINYNKDSDFITNIIILAGKESSDDKSKIALGVLNIKQSSVNYFDIVSPKLKFSFKNLTPFFVSIDKLVIFGANNNQEEIYDEIWTLNFTDLLNIKLEKIGKDPQIPLLGSNFVNINNTLFAFSKFDEQLSMLTDNILYKIDLKNLLDISHCDIGNEFKNGNCEPCQLSFYKSALSKNGCQYCGIESTYGATSPSDCIPNNDFDIQPYINKALNNLKINNTEIPDYFHSLPKFDYNLLKIVIGTLICSLILIFLLSMIFAPSRNFIKKFDYFNLNLKKKFKKKKEKLVKSLKKMNKGGNFEEIEKNQVKNELTRIEIEFENDKKIGLRNEIRGICTGFVIMSTLIFACFVFSYVLWPAEIETKEYLTLSQYTNEYQSIEAIVDISLFFYPIFNNSWILLPADRLGYDLEFIDHTSEGYFYKINFSALVIDTNISNELPLKIKIIGGYASKLGIIAQSFNNNKKFSFIANSYMSGNLSYSFTGPNPIELHFSLAHKHFEHYSHLNSEPIKLSSVKINTVNIEKAKNFNKLLDYRTEEIKINIFYSWDDYVEVSRVQLIFRVDISLILFGLLVVFCEHSVLKWIAVKLIKMVKKPDERGDVEESRQRVESEYSEMNYMEPLLDRDRS